MAALFLSAVVCEGVAADDDEDESLLSCLKIFLSLSIVLGRAVSPGLYDLGGVLAACSMVKRESDVMVRAGASKTALRHCGSELNPAPMTTRRTAKQEIFFRYHGHMHDTLATGQSIVIALRSGRAQRESSSDPLHVQLVCRTNMSPVDLPSTLGCVLLRCHHRAEFRRASLPSAPLRLLCFQSLCIRNVTGSYRPQHFSFSSTLRETSMIVKTA